MKWFTDFWEKISPKKEVVHGPYKTQFVGVSVPDREMIRYVEWNNELFNLCWDREALLVEIETAKRQKKKSSHLIAALVRNTQRRLELELAHNGKSSA